MQSIVRTINSTIELEKDSPNDELEIELAALYTHTHIEDSVGFEINYTMCCLLISLFFNTPRGVIKHPHPKFLLKHPTTGVILHIGNITYVCILIHHHDVICAI